jgi:hypothetical protein
MTSTENSTYWQADDKSIIVKVFLMLGLFGAVMIAIAIGISFVV